MSDHAEPQILDAVRIAQEWFSYEPATGAVTWKKKPAKRIVIGSRAGYRWSDGANTYIRITVQKQQIFAHIVAFILMTGRLPAGVVDHEDGDGVNNKWTNLRDVTHAGNLRNQRRNRNNTSDTMGVDFHAASQRWRARIIVDQQERHLGVFTTKAEAIDARKTAERTFGFHPNHGRTA